MTQTIALVDDDRNILTSISMALEREGFKVQTYIDGETALIGLTRNPPDLAILDFRFSKSLFVSLNLFLGRKVTPKFSIALIILYILLFLRLLSPVIFI